MMKYFGILLISLHLFSAGCAEKGVSYYIDSQKGNDNNPGTSKNRAFASLDRANNVVLNPGDQLLFRSGTKYYGQLKPKGGGNQQQMVVIGKYGGDVKPVINGEGNFLTALHIYNMSFVEVRDLEITNSGKDRKRGRRGVIVEADNFGLASNIILDNLFIHNVNGSLVKSKGGGSAILWKNHGKKLKTKFDSLIIQNCHLKDCARNGINSRGYTSRDNWYPSTNVIIRNNLLEGIPGDGIVPIGTDGTLIEYNIMRDCPDILSYQEAAAGIWPWSADNTLIQFNEVSGHKAKWDGQGFDSDWNCLNTIIQYNYSHDNYGGFLLVCNNGGNYDTPANIGTHNTIIRYNISVNDGIRPYDTKRRGPFSPVLHISGPVEKTLIHHNLFIFPEGSTPDPDNTFIQMDNWGGPWPVKTLFAFNTLDISEPLKIFYGKSKQNWAVGNDYDMKMLELESQDMLPAWTEDILTKHDEEYPEKLINAFFMKNEDMKQRIGQMQN